MLRCDGLHNTPFGSGQCSVLQALLSPQRKSGAATAAKRHSATAAPALQAPLIADKGTGSAANLSDVYMAGLNLTHSSFADVCTTWPSFLEPPLSVDGVVAEGVTPGPLPALVRAHLWQPIARG